MDSHSKVLITGIEGFTGHYLEAYLIKLGCKVFGLKADLTNKKAVLEEVENIKPDYVVHLAGISFAAETDVEATYKVNVIGSINLLDALAALKTPLKKVILASSATVYGNLTENILNENLCPKPISHYGCSKLTMEHMSQNFMGKFPILIARPFNYTGIGHSERFLIPKIIKAYQTKKTSLELGNLDVSREFNDVRDVCGVYASLLNCPEHSTVVNICSGKATSLMDIIDNLDQMTGEKMDIKVNPDFVRQNEIKNLSGSTDKLDSIVKTTFKYHIRDTLQWMYKG